MEKRIKALKSVDILKRIMRVYSIGAEEVYDFIVGKRETLYHFTKEMIFIRIFERLSWYEILELFPLPIIKNMVSRTTIEKLRSTSLKEKYEYARRVLQKEAVSTSRWYHRDHQEYPYPLLSDTWYGSQ
jgi:hypothetical protein